MVRSNTALTQVQALELIAQNSNFSSYHELIQVAKKTPLESRLLIAAFGDSDFKDVIYNLYGSCTDGPYPSLEIAVEEELSDLIATTNADGFTIEDLEITDAFYDDTRVFCIWKLHSFTRATSYQTMFTPVRNSKLRPKFGCHGAVKNGILSMRILKSLA